MGFNGMDELGGKPAAAYFVVQHGAQQGQTALIDPRRPVFVIGSDPRCNLQLSDPSVASSHAAVSVGDGGCVIRPRFPASAVYVNGERVRDFAHLKPGDTVQVGDAALRFRYDSEYSDATLPVVTSGIKPAVLPSYVSASRYAAPARALQPAAVSVVSAGPHTIHYPKPAEKAPNVMVLMAGYLGILGVIGLFAYLVVARFTTPAQADFYSQFPPGTVRILAFYADW